MKRSVVEHDAFDVLKKGTGTSRLQFFTTLTALCSEPVPFFNGLLRGAGVQIDPWTPTMRSTGSHSPSGSFLSFRPAFMTLTADRSSFRFPLVALNRFVMPP